MHAVIMTISYLLHSVFLHACGALMFPVNKKKNRLAKQTLNFRLVRTFNFEFVALYIKMEGER